MIKKLKSKISLIILCAIAIPLIIIVSIYTYSYYNDTIRANIGFVDRFIGEPNHDFEEIDEVKNKKRDKPPEIPNMEGIYYITITNGYITNYSDNTTDEIKDYALKILNSNSEHGIIKNYIYQKRVHDMEKEISIVLVESSKEINKLNILVLSSIFGSIIGVVLIYFLSKKIACIIVKPVEDTFKKQIDFISDASHELKTPLAVIQANADVLEGELENNKWLTYIQNETDNMSKLINEMLLLTKIENIDSLREPERFNMSDHIELIVSSFESMAFEKNVKIESEIQKDIVTDKFNKDDITHILGTLIDNAIKHTEEKKKVIISFSKNKDKLVIDVKNKGEEIPIEEREKIFDRFYRIDKSRNRNEKRYGLGLAIAKATVLKNNGTIQVDCKYGYTTFTVELPL